MKRWKIFLGIFLIVVISGCATASSAFKSAKQEDTVAAYEEYLAKYPDSEFSRQAETRLEELYFEKARKADTIEAYKDYLEKYPDGKYAEQAKPRLEELSFEEARKVDTIEAYEGYLEKYPDGKYAEQTEARVEELYFEWARKTDTIETYKEYLLKYPDGRFVKGVRDNLLGKILDSVADALLEDEDESISLDEIKYEYKFSKNILTIKWDLYFLEDPFALENLGIIDAVYVKVGKIKMRDLHKFVAAVNAVMLAYPLCVPLVSSQSFLEMSDITVLDIFISHKIRRYKLDQYGNSVEMSPKVLLKSKFRLTKKQYKNNWENIMEHSLSMVEKYEIRKAIRTITKYFAYVKFY